MFSKISKTNETGSEKKFKKKNLVIMANNKKILYVGGLSEQVSRDILYNAFIPFGDVVQVTLPLDFQTSKKLKFRILEAKKSKKKKINNNNNKIEIDKSRGFGFVEFELQEDAAAAIENMNNGELFGKTLHINYANQTALLKEGFLNSETNSNETTPATTKKTQVNQ